MQTYFWLLNPEAPRWQKSRKSDFGIGNSSDPYKRVGWKQRSVIVSSPKMKMILSQPLTKPGMKLPIREGLPIKISFLSNTAGSLILMPIRSEKRLLKTLLEKRPIWLTLGWKDHNYGSSVRSPIREACRELFNAQKDSSEYDDLFGRVKAEKELSFCDRILNPARDSDGRGNIVLRDLNHKGLVICSDPRTLPEVCSWGPETLKTQCAEVLKKKA